MRRRTRETTAAKAKLPSTTSYGRLSYFETDALLYLIQTICLYAFVDSCAVYSDLTEPLSLQAAVLVALWEGNTLRCCATVDSCILRHKHSEPTVEVH